MSGHGLIIGLRFSFRTVLWSFSMLYFYAIFIDITSMHLLAVQDFSESGLSEENQQISELNAGNPDSHINISGNFP